MRVAHAVPHRSSTRTELRPAPLASSLLLEPRQRQLLRPPRRYAHLLHVASPTLARIRALINETGLRSRFGLMGTEYVAEHRAFGVADGRGLRRRARGGRRGRGAGLRRSAQSLRGVADRCGSRHRARSGRRGRVAMHVAERRAPSARSSWTARHARRRAVLCAEPSAGRADKRMRPGVRGDTPGRWKFF